MENLYALAQSTKHQHVNQFIINILHTNILQCRQFQSMKKVKYLKKICILKITYSRA